MQTDEYREKICAHHLDGFHWCKEHRFDVENGITLCNDCHRDFHFYYGSKHNTEHQFKLYQFGVTSFKKLRELVGAN